MERIYILQSPIQHRSYIHPLLTILRSVESAESTMQPSSWTQRNALVHSHSIFRNLELILLPALFTNGCSACIASHSCTQLTNTTTMASLLNTMIATGSAQLNGTMMVSSQSWASLPLSPPVRPASIWVAAQISCSFLLWLPVWSRCWLGGLHALRRHSVA